MKQLEKISTSRFTVVLAVILLTAISASAQDISAGTTALAAASENVKRYVPLVRDLIYALAGVVALIGAISVYIKMNNEEQDVKKSIMMVVGACVFLVIAASALPAFFGL